MSHLPLPNILFIVDPKAYFKHYNIDTTTNDNDVKELISRIISLGDWGLKLMNLSVILPEWTIPINTMIHKGKLQQLGMALDEYEIHNGKLIVPHPDNVFSAYSSVKLSMLSVVFVGQDPYPTSDKTSETLKTLNKESEETKESILGCNYKELGIGLSENNKDKITSIPYAIGKAFAVPNYCKKLPGTLENIREAVYKSTGKKSKASPNLDLWTSQGILLMNSSPILMKKSSKTPNMWTGFTTEMLNYIGKLNPTIVFVLLGNSAKYFKSTILNSNPNALIFEVGHPSRRNLTSSESFLNSNIFSRINEFRKEISRGSNMHLKPIEW